jgi:Protein of unknown function (DUF2795)
MDNAGVAELKTALIGVALPADKTRLLEYAVRQRVEPQQLDALRSLPDREFESLDEVSEELLRMQPRGVSDGGEPHEESGQPPCGDDYTRAHPTDTGTVRERGEEG